MCESNSRRSGSFATVAFPESGASNPVGLQAPPRRLDTSVEVSGPHDFTVRSTRLRQKASPGLALQLPICFAMRTLSGGLVSSAPE
jgi:hypothetical protein